MVINQTLIMDSSSSGTETSSDSSNISTKTKIISENNDSFVINGFNDTNKVASTSNKQYKTLTEKSWNIKASPRALATVNPIRRIIETMNLNPNKEKPFIPLSIGDPTLFGNFKPCDEIIESLLNTITSSKFNGYQPASGNEQAKQAVADYCSTLYSMNVTSKDIILTSGCSHALDMAMSSLSLPGCNMLVPKPGFPLYKTLSSMLEIEIRYYNLLPEKNWQIDLKDLEMKIDEKTVAIIYNNPSNPCGSVFSEQHILNFLQLVQKHRLPVIADEIYENIVFPGHQFYALASLTDEVPVLHCSGTTKKFLIPGWRLGWIAINDPKGRLGKEIRMALNSLSQRIIGPNTLVQGAICSILTKTPKTFFAEIIQNISKNADLAFTRLKMINGLTPIKPNGAFYMMVRIEMNHFSTFRNDLHLVETLVAEESVFCLPGACFEYPSYVRLVLAVDTDMLIEALNRIENFCKKYYISYDDNILEEMFD